MGDHNKGIAFPGFRTHLLCDHDSSHFPVSHWALLQLSWTCQPLFHIAPSMFPQMPTSSHELPSPGFLVFPRLLRLLPLDSRLFALQLSLILVLYILFLTIHCVFTSVQPQAVPLLELLQSVHMSWLSPPADVQAPTMTIPRLTNWWTQRTFVDKWRMVATPSLLHMPRAVALYNESSRAFCLRGAEWSRHPSTSIFQLDWLFVVLDVSCPVTVREDSQECLSVGCRLFHISWAQFLADCVPAKYRTNQSEEEHELLN